MSSFTGTLDKCKACDKTVYFVDLLSAVGVTYHKSCFKCSHCKGTLVMSNYSSMDGVLYCKTRFEQLFKESGNFSKNFQNGKPERDNCLTKAPNKLSALFSGTQDKCPACSKTVYPLEKMTMEGESFHKSCFKCAHGACHLTHSNYASLDGILYCNVHFHQLFMEKGNYQHTPPIIRRAPRSRIPSARRRPTQRMGWRRRRRTRRRQTRHKKNSPRRRNVSVSFFLFQVDTVIIMFFFVASVEVVFF